MKYYYEYQLNTLTFGDVINNFLRSKNYLIFGITIVVIIVSAGCAINSATEQEASVAQPSDPVADPSTPSVPNDPSTSSPACVDSNQSICTSKTSCSERLSFSQNTTVEVFRNNSLDKVHCSITHAVVILHGRDRNPDDYFSYAMDAATLAGRSGDTLVISPYFREQTDPSISSDLYWNRDIGSSSNNDWAMGGESYAPEKISSYTVVDEIIKSIASSGNFPNLKSIVVAGHSAGGQLAHRYAITGNFNNSNLTQQFFYVSANPSSYVYLNEERPVSGGLTSFEVPDSTGCSSYNKWGYGLLNPNLYVSNLTSSQLIGQYTARNVTYLLGDADTSADGMDTTCYANLQGSNRFNRGTSYFNFMSFFFPTHAHVLSIVPGIGHSGGSMIKSSQGVSALFPVVSTGLSVSKVSN